MNLLSDYEREYAIGYFICWPFQFDAPLSTLLAQCVQNFFWNTHNFIN